MVTEDAPTPPPFCDQCGVSLVPLASPHLIRPCGVCGRTTHVVETGPDGRGLFVRVGDQLTLPPGSITISFDPSASTMRFAPIGLRSFVGRAYMGALAEQDATVDSVLTAITEEAEKLLNESPMLADLDGDDDKTHEETFRRIEKDPYASEWWAGRALFGAVKARVALREGNADDAAVALARATVARAMAFYLQHMDRHTWTGYQVAVEVADAGRAASADSAEARKMDVVRPALERLDDAILIAWRESGEPVGPRLNVPESLLSEGTMRGMLAAELSGREARRREAAERKAAGVERWKLVIAGFAAGGVFIGGVWTIVSGLG